MKILCVDDDPLVLSITCSLLRELGHDVIDAPGSGQAINSLGGCGTELDMLITDVRMPHIDGKEVAAYARLKLPHLRVIYFTGYAEVEPEETSWSRLLRKPCSIGSLQRAIDSLGAPARKSTHQPAAVQPVCT